MPAVLSILDLVRVTEDTDARDLAAHAREALRLVTTQKMSFTNLIRGKLALSQPPIDDIDTYWTPTERAQVHHMLARSIVGSPETVRVGIDAIEAETGADELIVVSDIYDHAARLRSFELIAATQAADTEPEVYSLP